MNTSKKTIYLILGPVIFITISIILQKHLTIQGSRSVGLLMWMIFWWITNPVNMTVTAFLPVIINAAFHIIPMNSIISQYSSSSLILIFGAGLLSLGWSTTGLDKRIALKALYLIGPSMTSQITAWFMASVILSSFMPNVAVCALYCPIAVTMLQEAGYMDIKNCKQATLILMAIGWGAGIGGVGSPLGGAMNITAISYLQNHLNQEFMYINWIIRTIPYLFVCTSVILLILIQYAKSYESISGTKEYFKELLSKQSPISYDEKICGLLFIIAIVLSFLRPLYASVFPTLEPAYIFLICGSLLFVLPKKNHQTFINWQLAEKNTMWGMMLLFGGGIALGNMINESGADEGIAELINILNLHHPLFIMFFFAIFAVLLSETTNSTVSAAVLTPILFTTLNNTSLNPIPFWFSLCIFFNAEFLLPISVRAIPASYGLNTKTMLVKGIPVVIIRLILAITYCYICYCFIPGFNTLSY